MTEIVLYKRHLKSGVYFYVKYFNHDSNKYDVKFFQLINSKNYLDVRVIKGQGAEMKPSGLLSPQLMLESSPQAERKNRLQSFQNTFSLSGTTKIANISV